MTDLDPAVEYATSPTQYRGPLSPRMEAMLRYIGERWLVDVIRLALDSGPWSVETEKALARRGLVARVGDRWEVALTQAGWLWLLAHPKT